MLYPLPVQGVNPAANGLSEVVLCCQLTPLLQKEFLLLERSHSLSQLTESSRGNKFRVWQQSSGWQRPPQAPAMMAEAEVLLSHSLCCSTELAKILAMLILLKFYLPRTHKSEALGGRHEYILAI